MTVKRLKRKPLEQLAAKYSVEELKKNADEFDVLVFEKKKDEFISNVEINLKISKYLKRLGETKTYIEPKYAHLRQIAFYIFRFGIQRGDVFGINLEKRIFMLIKQLSVLDNFSLYILSYSFRGMIYKFNKESKNENDGFLKIIDKFDELDYGNPEVLDYTASLKNSSGIIDKLAGKFNKFIDPYETALIQVKKNPKLYTKFLIPIESLIKERFNLRYDRDFINHVYKLTNRRIKKTTIERALNRYRTENRAYKNP